MTRTIKERSIVFMFVGVLLLITWGVGTILIIFEPHFSFISIFFYIYGSVIAFILLNLEYRWIAVK